MDSRGPSSGEPTEGGVYASLKQKAGAELEHERAAASRWAKAESLAVGGLALAALALCSYNVVVRYLFPWLTLEMADEVQVYLVVWAVFLALGEVTLADRHVKADLFVSMFPARLRKGLEIATDLLGLSFAALLVAYGAAIAWQAWSYGDVSTTTLRFPLWIYIAALPVGAFVLGVGYVIRLLRQRRSRAS